MKNIAKKLKTLVRWLHLWLGLFSGIIVFIISITGCIYVFQSEISQITEPWRFVAKQDASFVAPSRLLETAKIHVSDIEPIGVTYSGKEEAAAVGFWKNNDDGGVYTVVFLNPYNAEFIKKQTIIGGSDFNFFRFILNGHRSLWLPYETGHKILGYSVLIFVFLLITGLIMWWPKRWNRKSLHRNFTINWRSGWKRLNHDAHNILGFYITIFALIIAVTGLTWSFEWVGKSIHFVASGGSPKTEITNNSTEKFQQDSSTISTENALDICFYKALQQEPDPSRIYFSPILDNKNKFEFIFYKYKGKYYNSNSYYYDTRTLASVRVPGDRYTESAFADKLGNMYYDLHTGGILGITGKIIAFLVSLICASLPVTGFIIWYKKKKTKRTQVLSDQNLLILYGTKTGNAKLVANELNKHSSGDNIKPLLMNMSHTTPEILLKFKKVLIIVSTHDEGDPPPSARKFYKQLISENSLDLHNLQFAVCGLGDSDYDLFCEAGKVIEKRLLSFGATAFLERKDCDADFASEAGKWIKEVLVHLVADNTLSDNKMDQLYIGSTNFYEGKIAKCEKLATDEDGDSTYHLEINNFNRNIRFTPGDLIEILPENPLWLVNSIAALLKTDSFNDLFLKEKEICRINRNLMNAYAELTGSKELNSLLQKEESVRAYSDKANLLDLLTDFPASPDAKEILQILPSLKGRQYSVTNYQKEENGELHLMIKAIRYAFMNRKHEGAASVYTCENLKTNDSIHFKHIPNPEFYLPEDKNTPLIFIGSGTGFAPIRAFVQQWNQNTYKSKAWIIWGEKNHFEDHKYFREMKALSNENTNLYIDFVSSRNESGEFRYVQDVILSKSMEVAKWINEGASIYLCGSKKMGKGVDSALEQILLLNKNLKSVREIKESGRYLASVY